MSFLGNEAKTTLTFSPLLRTREQIQITAYFVILGSPKLTYYLPFVPEAPYLARLTAELTQVAAATAHTWALGFPSAEDCLTKEAYVSLEAEFRRLDSPEFRVDRAIVTNIVPLTPRMERPVPKESRAARVITELKEDAEVAQEVHEFKASWVREHEEFSVTKTGQRMQDKIDAKAYEILLNRRLK
jgi:hypothetical protein